jgi:hypothetical protein
MACCEAAPVINSCLQILGSLPLSAPFAMFIGARFCRRERAMKAFIGACIAAAVLAVIGVVVLNHVQEPADQAFATPYARVS